MSSLEISNDKLNWNAQGLMPAIAQDAESGEVLMLAWMNTESLQLTLKEGIAVYWSRSRQALWRKGETSGHTQIVKDVRLDCDQDTILLKVEQIGGIACHTGRSNCFFLQHDQGVWRDVEKPVKNPKEIYPND